MQDDVQNALNIARLVTRRSLALAGSLHPCTRSAVRRFATPHAALGVEDGKPSTQNAYRSIQSPELIVLEAARLMAQGPDATDALYAEVQRRIEPVNGGLWSVVPKSLTTSRPADMTLALAAWLAEVERVTVELQPERVKAKIMKLVADAGLNSAVVLPLLHIYAAGPVTPAEFAQMLGYAERHCADDLVIQLLADSVLTLDGDTQLLMFVGAAALLPG